MHQNLLIYLVLGLFTSFVCPTGFFVYPAADEDGLVLTVGQSYNVSWEGVEEYSLLSLMIAIKDPESSTPIVKSVLICESQARSCIIHSAHKFKWTRTHFQRLTTSTCLQILSISTACFVLKYTIGRTSSDSIRLGSRCKKCPRRPLLPPKQVLPRILEALPFLQRMLLRFPTPPPQAR